MYYKRMRPLLGTFVEVASLNPKKDMDKVFESVFDKIELVQNLLSFHKSDSDLSLLNRSSINQKITMHPISIITLRLARRIMTLTDNLFDMTLGGKLIKLEVLPHPDKSKDFQDNGSASDLVVKGYTASLLKPISLSLDGIAKGLAVDLAVKEMKRNGIESGYVNAGGDLRIFGEAQLPIQRRNHNGKLENLGIFKNISLATSTVRKEFDSSYPGLILSNGNIPNEPRAWTVIAQSAWLADSLTKVAASNNLEKKNRIINACGARIL